MHCVPRYVRKNITAVMVYAIHMCQAKDSACVLLAPIKKFTIADLLQTSCALMMVSTKAASNLAFILYYTAESNDGALSHAGCKLYCEDSKCTTGYWLVTICG